ncbi:uncharacterized protein LOC121367897 isoform X2 [Gigantopelta aegis]|uniref:uncharacterized protein LOC121367897 isoform X2 n=1 Tax=Gigantopelta aegis TaxID=1735272 RepID=UPI001B888477|nr:uncharacterized protein LOC121367897 isoform X2 [Gigantopelta aegis]
MSAGVMQVLSQCGEDEFEKTINEMPLKGLMEMITYFQKEMAAEQENFNSLCGELQGIRDRNSRQYKQISKEMMKSQNRLTLLMNRSMKCFAQKPSAMSNGVNSVLPNKVTMRTNVVKRNENRNSFPLTSNNAPGSENKNQTVNGTAVSVPEPKKKMSTLNINPSVGQQWNTSLMSPRPRADSLDTRTASLSSPNKTVSSFSNVTIVSKAKSVSNLVDDSGPKSNSSSSDRLTNIRSGSSSTINSAGSGVANTNGRFVTNQRASGPVMMKSVSSEPKKVTGRNFVINNGASSLKAQNNNKSANSNKKEPSSGLGSKDALLKEIESRRKLQKEEDSLDGKVGDETYKTSVSLVPSERGGERPRSGSAESRTSAGSQSESTSDSDSLTNGTTEISTATLVVKADRPAGNQNPPEKPRRMSRPKCVQDSEDTTNLQTATPSVTGPNVKAMSSSLDQTPVHPMTAASASVSAAGNVKVVSSDPSQRIQLEDDDEITPTMNLRPWNPSAVLKELFTVRLMEDTTEDISGQFVCMEGYMEKLPMNKKKATLLKTWKRRFFKATDGWLYYYETSDRSKPSETIQLMGGNIHDLGNRILGIDDGRGRFLMVRCPTDKEHGQWKLALDTQTADNTKARYIHPLLKSPPHPQKKVVIIDMGSNAVRAGILGQRPTLPELFFPSVVAVHNTTSNMVVGMEAYFPGIRHKSKLFHPIRATNKIDKFSIDERQMPAVFSKVFHDLRINPGEYLVMLSTPMDLSDNLRKNLMMILVDSLQVAGVCMVQQALLSLYSYNTTSGIIVDVGETIEILPIYDGFVIEGGVTMLPYGAEKIEDSLQISLMTENYRFSSRIERLLVKYIMEKSCYVASDFKSALEQCKTNREKMSCTVDFEPFDLPPGAYPSITHDISRFKSPEGLFDMDMWEMDFPNLHKLIFQAIQTCPMDSRRHMYRSVYLSGGVTMLPGFRERLQSELVKLAPPNVPIEVHAAPQRYHAAYIGACSVAGMDVFQQMCISRETWRTEGINSFKKWKAPKG